MEKSEKQKQYLFAANHIYSALLDVKVYLSLDDNSETAKRLNDALSMSAALVRAIEGGGNDVLDAAAAYLRRNGYYVEKD